MSMYRIEIEDGSAREMYAPDDTDGIADAVAEWYDHDEHAAVYQRAIRGTVRRIGRRAQLTPDDLDDINAAITAAEQALARAHGKRERYECGYYLGLHWVISVAAAADIIGHIATAYGLQPPEHRQVCRMISAIEESDERPLAPVDTCRQTWDGSGYPEHVIDDATRLGRTLAARLYGELTGRHTEPLSDGEWRGPGADMMQLYELCCDLVEATISHLLEEA